MLTFYYLIRLVVDCVKKKKLEENIIDYIKPISIRETGKRYEKCENGTVDAVKITTVDKT